MPDNTARDPHDVWGPAAAATETWCAAHPRDAAIRDHLLNLDAGYGWGPPLEEGPQLFEMHHDPDRHQVSHRDPDQMQAMLDHLCAASDGDVGNALLVLAEVSERAAGLLRDDPAYVPGAGAADLYDVEERPGWLVLGWGLISESWWVTRDRLADLDKITGRVGDEPDRKTMRMTTVADRYGALWFVYRLQDGEERPLAVRVDPDEYTLEVQGNVAQGLARMTQAVVGPAVPIPDDGRRFWDRQRGARDE